MHLVTIDIVILGLIAILIIGVHIGLLISTYIFAKPIEKSKAKKVKNLNKYSDITACIPNEKSGNCPVCNNFMIGEVPFCKECGQALDWGILNE